MKTTKFFLLLAVAVITSIFLTYIVYNYVIIEKAYTLDMELKIGDHFGLNADADAIKFGMLMPGTSSERSIIVNNNANYPLRVVILKYGDIADWVEISENNFVLEKKEGRYVIFEAFAPKNTNFGNYTGKVRIGFKRNFFNG